MKVKKIVFLLMFFNSFQLAAMAMDESEHISEEINYRAQLPDELALCLISFAVRGDSVRETIKCLMKFKFIDKQHRRLCSDIYLIKSLFILHLYDTDYQDVLSKILFKASCCNNDYIINVLAQAPYILRLRSENRMAQLLDSDEIELMESIYGTKISCKETSFIESNINSTDSFGYTPLLHAVERGNEMLLEAFLNYGALVVVKNKDNDTSLILAAKKGHKEITKKLLTFEAIKDCIDGKGFGGNTAFLCVAKQFINTVELDKENNYSDILQLLANHGADVNSSDAANLSAMDWAAKEGKTRLISELLDLKAHFTKENKTRLECYLFGAAVNEEIKELLEKIRVLEEKVLKILIMKLELKNEPYWLSFKINEEEYKCEVENKTINEKFAEKIGKLDDEALARVGDAIVDMVFITGATPNSIIKNCSYDSNDYRLAFLSIFGQILFGPYFYAKKNSNQIVMNKIREIIKPIFKAYPEKDTSIYGNFLKKYELSKSIKK